MTPTVTTMVSPSHTPTTLRTFAARGKTIATATATGAAGD
jgi:hypothetical protein